MPSLNAKPLTLSQKLVKRIFGGTPKVYTDVDINQQSDIFVDTLHRMADRVGAVSESFVVTETTLTASQVIGTNTYVLTYNLSFGGGGYCYHKNVRFDIPAFAYNASITRATLTSISIYLVAKTKTIAFADDNAIGGVAGGGLGSPIASSDAFAYYDERVELCENNVLPTLASGEEIICKLVSVAFRKREWLNGGVISIYDPHLVYDAPSIQTLNLLPEPETSSNARDIMGWLGRLRVYLLKVKDHLDLFTIVNPEQDHVMYYDLVGGVPYKFRNKSIYDFIRSVKHQFTKLQSWGGGSSCTFSTLTGGVATIYISDAGNSFILDLEGTIDYYTGATFDDIKLKIGAVVSDVPTGTIIVLKVKSSDQGLSGNPPGFSTNFDYLYNQSQTSGADLHLQGLTPNTKPFYLYHDDTIVLYKTATKWDILSNIRESRRHLVNLMTSLSTITWIPVDGLSGNPALVAPRTSLANYEVAFSKNYLGFVKIRGTIVVGNTSSGAIFTLPVGYRPLKSAEFICPRTGGGAISLRVDVDPTTGVVSMVTSGTNSADQVSLETIGFYVT